MNTSEEQPEITNTSSIFSNTEEEIRYGADDVIARLERENEDLKNSLVENKFLAALVVVIMFDFFAFQRMESWTGPVVIGILQIVFLWVYARICKVDDVVRLTEHILAGLERLRPRADN